MTGAILVGVDGEPEHRSALTWAVERAMRDGTDLELVYVIERSWGDRLDEPMDDLVRAAEGVLAAEREAAARIAGRVSSTAGATARGSGIGDRPPQITTGYRYGHVGAELTEASRGAGLLVLGSRVGSERERERRFSGSLQVRTAATAACSVAVVPHGWERGGTAAAGVVVGVDGQAPSEAAVAFAADEADALGEPLRIVCVGYAANPLLAGLVPEVSLGDRRQRIVAQAAESARAAHPSIAVSADVVEASPARGLVAAAEGSRMLVVGTHDRRSAERLMLGSVAHDVLLNVRVPVVVAREHRGSA